MKAQTSATTGTVGVPRRWLADRRLWAFVATAVVVGIAVVVLLGFGNRWGGSGYTDNCANLPLRADAEKGWAKSAAVIEQLKAVGPGVSVTLESRCGAENRAAVVITHGSDEEEAKVMAILQNADGFGAPADVRRK